MIIAKFNLLASRENKQQEFDSLIDKEKWSQLSSVIGSNNLKTQIVARNKNKFANFAMLMNQMERQLRTPTDMTQLIGRFFSSKEKLIKDTKKAAQVKIDTRQLRK